VTGHGLIPGRDRDFSPHLVQTGSGAHPVSYPVGTGGSFPGGKAAVTWSLPLPSNAEVKTGGGIPPFPDTSSWCDA
jgi:hypothetical protein